MEAHAVARHIRVSPRKVRLIMDQIRGRKVEEALHLLAFSPQKGSAILKKLVDSAVANAAENNKANVDKLFIKKIFADQGPTLKRFQPRSMGRANRILKRTSHLTVIIDEA